MTKRYWHDLVDGTLVENIPLAELTTDPATSITSDAATLGGSVDTLEGNTGLLDYFFEWGEVGAGFPNSTTPSSTSAAPITYTSDISGLSQNTDYEFRAAGTVDGETFTGGTQTFTTQSAIPDSAIAHYDAQALSAFNDGESVSSWPDELNNFDASGNGGPIYRESGINGHPSIEFDGTDDRYTATGLNISQPNTIFAVVEGSGLGDGSRYYVVDGDADRNLLRFDDNDEWGIYAGSEVYGSTDTTVQLLAARFDGANSLLREDGAETLSADAGTEGLDDLIIGAQVGGNNQWSGYIGEIVVCDGGLASSEIQDEEQRLADKWGISI